MSILRKLRIFEYTPYTKISRTSFTYEKFRDKEKNS